MPGVVNAACRNRKAFLSVDPVDGGPRGLGFRLPTYRSATRPSTQEVAAIVPQHHKHERDQLQHTVDSAIRAAESAEAEYLLIYATSCQTRWRQTPLAVLNLLILPMFVLPLEAVEGDVYGKAWLIDVRAKATIASESAVVKRSRLTPSHFVSATAQDRVNDWSSHMGIQLVNSVARQLEQ